MLRILFAILLVAHTVGLASPGIYQASDPMPQCLPCPDGR